MSWETNIKKESALEGSNRNLATAVSIFVSTSSISVLAPKESTTDRIQNFIKHCENVVKFYNGNIGDHSDRSLMIVFGLGEFCDKNPIDACLFAREIILAAKQSSLEIKVGINTGEIRTNEHQVIDSIDLETRKTLSNALMIRELCDPDSILVSDRTSYFIQDSFDLDKMNLDEIFSFPLFRLKDQKPSTSARFHTFVGRYLEIERIKEAYKKSISGEKTIFLITGNAGIGKSAIAHEFLNQASEAEFINFSFTRAQDKESIFLETVFHQLLIKLYTQISWEKLYTGSLILPFAYEELQGTSVSDISWTMLSMRERNHYKISIIERLAEQLSKQKRLVFVFEDVHWKTGTFINFLERLYKNAEIDNTFVLLTARQASDIEEKINVKKIKLDVLDSDSAQLLLEAWLGTNNDAKLIADEILKKCPSNPFYLTEYIRSLISSGKIVGRKRNYKLVGDIADLKLPETVDMAISSQIKSLPEVYRNFLRKASVLGFTFNAKDLQDIFSFDDGIKDLASSLHSNDYIVPLSKGKFRFRHALLQEYIHDGLDGKEKQDMHSAALDYFRTSPGKILEKIKICSYHAFYAKRHNLSLIYNYIDCLQSLEAEDIERALLGFERALVSYKLLPAKRYQRNIIRYINLCFAFSKIMCIKGSHDLSNIIINKVDHHINDISSHLVEVRTKLIASKLYNLWIGGDLKVAKEYARSAWVDISHQKAGSGYISAGVRCAGILSDAGDFYESNDIYEDLLSSFKIEERDKKHNLLFSAYPVTLVGISRNFGEVGEFEEAKKYSIRGISLIDSSLNLPSKAYVYAYGSSYLIRSKNYDLAINQYEQAYKICLDYDLSVLKPFIYAEYGYLNVKLGNSRMGIGLLESALNEINHQKLFCKQSYYYRLLALAHSHIGQYDLAYEAALQGGEMAFKSGEESNFAWNIFLAESSLYYIKNTLPDLDEVYNIALKLSLQPLLKLITQFRKENNI